MTFLKPSPSLLLKLPGTKQKQKRTPILNYFVLKLFSIESEQVQEDNLQRKREHEKKSERKGQETRVYWNSERPLGLVSRRRQWQQDHQYKNEFLFLPLHIIIIVNIKYLIHVTREFYFVKVICRNLYAFFFKCEKSLYSQ